MLLKKLKQAVDFFLKAGQRQICFELHTSKEVAVERLEEFLDGYFNGVVTNEGFIFYSKYFIFSDWRFQSIIIKGKLENDLPFYRLTVSLRIFIIFEVLYLLINIFFAAMIFKVLFFSSGDLAGNLSATVFLLIFPVMIRLVFQYRLLVAENKFIEYLSHLFNESELRPMVK